MIKKLFLDTNIFLRFIVLEDQKSHNETKAIFLLFRAGRLKPYTSNIVISELIYVLVKIYKQRKSKVIKKIAIILKIRNLTLIEKTDTKEALELYKGLNIKLGDCMIATQIPKGVVLCTYDGDFKKIPNLTVKTPGEIVPA
ncbi:PIN domain-containing protein [candidate division WWE3 bacterium]|nr:PIN domain-containing protein [candidate division WWE3 bacterium]